MLKLEVTKHIREEGDKKLFLLIAFDLPFNDIADVHHCGDKKKASGLWWHKQRKPYRVIADVNSCHVGGNSLEAYFSQTEKQKTSKNVGSYYHQYFRCVSNGWFIVADSSEVQLWVRKPTATTAEELPCQPALTSKEQTVFPLLKATMQIMHKIT